MGEQSKALVGSEGPEEKRLSDTSIRDHRHNSNTSSITSAPFSPPVEKPVSTRRSTARPMSDYDFRYLVDNLKKKASMREWLIFLGVEEKGHNKFLCPFHAEKEPSLSVHDSDMYATDFHDDEKYDHIKIARVMNGWDFWTAMKQLASFVGETLPERSNGNGKKYQIKQVKGEFTEEDIRRGYGNKIYVREHNYHDIDNRLLYKKVIYVNPDGGKDPLFYHPAGNGAWKTKRGCDATLYQIINLINNDIVYYVEGEKDAETLTGIGLPAITCGSAADTKTLQNPDILDRFKGKTVIIFYDNDAPGIKHMQKVAAILKPVAGSVKVVHLTGVAEGDDVTDWLTKRGGTKEELVCLIDAAEEYVVPAAPPEKDYLLTELGNADRFIDEHREKLCYVANFKSWYVWNGAGWKSDNRGVTKLLAKTTVRKMYEESLHDRDPEQKKYKHAKNSQSNKKIDAMIALAQPDLSVEHDIFDRNHYMLTVKNGTIDLDTMEFRDARREDFITKTAGTYFDPDAKCPTFEKFLLEIMEGNAELVRYIQRIAGYCLTGETSENAVFFLYGSGANGKSTLIGLLSEVLGDYADSVSPQSIMRKDNNSGNQANSEIAKLQGARLVSTVEPEENKILDESLIKLLTGGDRISARFLFQNEFSFIPVFKMLIATNHMPRIRGTDHAIWRRIHKIPFNAKFEGAKKDDNLKYRLRAEKPGILNWMIDGFQMWRDNKLTPPEEVLAATKAYRADMDVIAGFIDECCEVSTGVSAASSELYDEYKAWCDANGEYCVKQKTFSTKLIEKGFMREKGRTHAIFHGIKPKPGGAGTNTTGESF
ncbi:MAG: phage/plasmid primase, P4 family [Nitrospiraceae bacterium]|nr:phage/plasmid primase, P4 family [Nitrospiraceae bacterium]